MKILLSRKFGVALGVCLSFSSAGPLWAGEAADKAVALCDELASSTFDTTRPPEFKGVKRGDIDANKAIPACKQAMQLAPGKARIVFEYARSLEASGKNVEKAFGAYKKAAEAGHVIAMNNLAYAYENGVGTARNLKKAAHWYLKSAEGGLSVAQTNIGIFYSNGKGVKQDIKQALVWLEKAAAQGEPQANNELGLLYDDGIKVKQDENKAVTYFKAAVDLGFGQAYSNLGWAYDRGVGGLPVDHVKANELYLAGADKGDSNAMNNYAESLLTGEGVAKDTKAGLEWLQKALDAGSGRAAYNLGVRASDGKSGPFDAEKSASLFISALERGNPEAAGEFVDNAGEHTPTAVINAMQDQLLARGAKFKKVDGSFNKDSVKYMQSLLGTK